MKFLFFATYRKHLWNHGKNTKFPLSRNSGIVATFLSTESRRNILQEYYHTHTWLCYNYGYGVLRHFQKYFSYILAVSFIGGWNWRKPPTCRKLPTNYTSPLSRFEPTSLVVIGTDWICSCKSNYHTITTTTDPMWLFKNGDIDYDFQ
jgi:hypothetical protein